jgi:hypothetical protein
MEYITAVKGFVVQSLSVNVIKLFFFITGAEAKKLQRLSLESLSASTYL